MKIGFYLSAFPILSETFILNQITGLIDRGHEVTIVAGRMGDTSVIHGDVTSYGLLEKLELGGDSYHHMPRNKGSRILKAIKLFVSSRKVPKGVLLKSLNVRAFGKDALTLNLFYRTYYERLHRWDVQIAHCHFGQNGEKQARVVSINGSRAAVATTFHGHDLSRDLLGSSANPYKCLFEYGDLFLPVSDVWKNTLIKLGCDESRIRVHRMGVSLGQQGGRRSLDGAISILTVARLVEKKGVKYAIGAIRILAEQQLDVKYEIVGGGPLLPELKKLVVAENLENFVSFCGPVSADVILDKMLLCDIFLLPSVTAEDGDTEGVPVVLMEAMANSIPCVSSVHSGIPELIENGISGMLAEEKDVATLVSQLSLLIKNPDLASSIGASGYERIAQEFEIGKLNNSLLQYFEILCQEHSISK